MKKLFTAIFFNLLSTTIFASEIPDAIQKFYAEEKLRHPGNYDIDIKFTSNKKNGENWVYILTSCRQGARWRCRNRLDCFVVKGNRILKVRKKEKSHDFWSAAVTASDFLFIDASEKGQKLTISACSGKKIDPQNDKTFLWAQAYMRESGRYLLPLPDGIPLKGISKETVEQFRQLSAKEEVTWLIERLKALPPPAEALNLLRRIDAIGEFSVPMKVARRQIFQKMLLNEKLGNAPRHLLFSLLFKANFISHEDFVIHLLADPLLGKRTFEKLISDNREEFRQLILQWSSDPEKKLVALRYSEELADEPSYCAQMLAAFPEPVREQLFFLIPVYAKEISKQGDLKIKKILKESSYAGNYQLLCQIAKWILKTEPAIYVPEIKSFLFRERNNPNLKRGILYPLLLASLCKAKDSDGITSAINYLGELKDHAEIENAKRIWGQDMAGTITIDRIISSLENLRKSQP